MMSILVFLLCSGCFPLASAANRLRYFTILTNSESCKTSSGEIKCSWSNAGGECKKEGQSLVTLYDRHDAEFVESFLVGCNEQSYWLGIRKGKDNVTTWSNGDQVIFSASEVNIKPEEQQCEAIEDGVWKSFSCSQRKPFLCQKGNDSFLIENKHRDWCQALQYCRTRYTDLASISNEQQNEELKSKYRNKTFWIGLLHDEWKWADKSCSTYRAWGQGQPKDECGIYPMMNCSFGALRCDNRKFVLCSKGSVRIITVSRNYTWEEALNYCEAHHTRLLWIEDPDDQEAVNQWLNYTYGSSSTETLWIGLRQSTIFGFWIWSDRIVDWSYWRNNRIPELSLSNHCGVVSTTDFRWRDEDCRERHYFLCEEDISYMEK